MSITETPIEKPAKRKRSPRKKPRRASFHKPEATGLAGLTVTDCCKACSADGCVISGATYCAHPRKGGLQGQDMHNNAAIERLNKARKTLASADASKRFG